MNILFFQYDNFFINVINNLKKDSKLKIDDFADLVVEPSDIDRLKNNFLKKSKKFKNLNSWSQIDKFFQKNFIEFLDIYNEHCIMNPHVSKKWGNKIDYYQQKNLFMYLSKIIHNKMRSNKYDLVIFGRYPHNGIDFILYKYCEFYKIKKIFFHQSHVPNKFVYSDTLENYGKLNLKLSKAKTINSNNNIISDKKPFWMNSFFFIKIRLQRLKKHSLKYILQKILFSFIDLISLENILIRYKVLKNNYLYNLNKKKFSKFVSHKSKYVLFLLHFQPEGTSSFFGKIFIDQLLAIEKLKKLIPKNWNIVVKEHPRQHFLLRDIFFFKRLNTIENAIYIEKGDTKELIKNCQFVSTITGTGSIEAIHQNKKVLLFGRAWFSECPGVFNYNQSFNFKKFINYKINKLNIKKFENKFLQNSFNGVVAPEWHYNYKKFNLKKNAEIVAKSIKSIIFK